MSIFTSRSCLLRPIAALAVFSVAGCSSGPSDSDIDKAIRTQVAADKLAMIKIISVKKIACVEAKGAPGYTCDVEVESEVPIVGKQKQTSSLRFVKSDSGWQVTR